MSPNLGVSWKPSSRWRFSGTAHAPEKVELSVGFTFLLPTGLQQGSTFPLVYDYMPWQLGAGAEYDLLKSRGRHPDRRRRPPCTGKVVRTTRIATGSPRCPLTAGTTPSRRPWGSPVSGTMPGRTLLDLQYKPSPVPAPDGAHQLRRQRPRRRYGRSRVRISRRGTRRCASALQTQIFWLIPRHQTKLPTPDSPDGGQSHRARPRRRRASRRQPGRRKPLTQGAQGLQTNNPGWPGFGSYGVVLGGGLYLSVTP